MNYRSSRRLLMVLSICFSTYFLISLWISLLGSLYLLFFITLLLSVNSAWLAADLFSYFIISLFFLSEELATNKQSLNLTRIYCDNLPFLLNLSQLTTLVKLPPCFSFYLGEHGAFYAPFVPAIGQGVCNALCLGWSQRGEMDGVWDKNITEIQLMTVKLKVQQTYIFKNKRKSRISIITFVSKVQDASFSSSNVSINQKGEVEIALPSLF